MNLIPYRPADKLRDESIIEERAARCARIDALTVRRRQAISECKLETPPEAHAVEEKLARMRAVDDTPRLAVLKAILRLRL